MKPLSDFDRRQFACALRLTAFAALALLALCAAWLWQAGRWLERPTGEPVAADLLVVLGGDRVLRVAELYRQGHAPWVLLTGLEAEPAAGGRRGVPT